MVRPRKSATWPRASSVGKAKTVPAKETVKAASPATLTTCISVRRAKPLRSAPSAAAKRWKRRTPAWVPRPTPRAVARLLVAASRPATRPAAPALAAAEPTRPRATPSCVTRESPRRRGLREGGGGGSGDWDIGEVGSPA